MSVTHIVTYDLMNRKDYRELFDALKAFSSCHFLGSVWLIKSHLTPGQIGQELAQYIDKDDKLFVARLAGDAAWTTSYPPDVLAWFYAGL
ncbi:MAG: hypothetical protein QM639_07370 [Rhodocyclaceae bacterium]|jgi:hypothetical protein